jgi:hypothetical protein
LCFLAMSSVLYDGPYDIQFLISKIDARADNNYGNFCCVAIQSTGGRNSTKTDYVSLDRDPKPSTSGLRGSPFATDVADSCVVDWLQFVVSER